VSGEKSARVVVYLLRSSGVAIGAASDQQIDGLREHVVMVVVV
jgi:hypothetical protein